MDSNAVKALITGGAGFIGSELTRQMASQARQVLVVDNLVNGRRGNIEELLGDPVPQYFNLFFKA
jgi:UDP-glucose 4-epimerase